MRLEEFLKESSTADVSRVLSAVAKSSVRVWEALPTERGVSGGTNPSGDRQAALDLFTNGEFSTSLMATGAVAELASEEEPQPLRGRGPLHVAMDPLDGSSNIETNNPLGSIFGIYDSPLPCPGERIIASAFVTYGPMVTLTFSTGKGVNRFGLVRRGSNFVFELAAQDLKIPDKPEVYGFGGLRREWIPPVERFVARLEQLGSKVRYCGTFVGDYNQVLKHGGIFGYPALKNKPRGKLRLLYEAAPMAFVTKAAGGYSTDGFLDLLKVEAGELSATTPVYTGSHSITKELERTVSSGSR